VGISESSTNRRPGSRRFDVAFYVPWIAPLLTSEDARPTGGAETQIYLLGRALAERGAKVCFLAFELPGISLPSSVDGVSVVVRPPYRSHQRFGKVREIASLFRAVVGVDAGVIVTRSAGPHVGLVGLAAKLSRRRFVYSSANLSDFDFGRLSPRRYNNALFRLGIRLADEIVVQTQEQARLCQERYGRTPVLIESIAETAPQRTSEPEAFLWMARLVWYKRPLAFVDLAESLPEAKFWMVGVPVPFTEGGPELLAELERRAAAVPNLELLSPRPRPVLMDLVERAVAVVNTADFEGMPNTFLEGWARGVPALALTHDPADVIETHDLGAFAHGSPERLTELARTYWEERNDQAEVALSCRRYIEVHHSPESVSGRWLKALGIGSQS
jgi:glycosyltransferase involved in cell wall biosynthesis